jgi:hypothetical protein
MITKTGSLQTNTIDFAISATVQPKALAANC